MSISIYKLGGFDKEKAMAVLNIPDTFELGVIMSVGYPGNPDELPETLKQRELAPRVRNVQAEFVRNESL